MKFPETTAICSELANVSCGRRRNVAAVQQHSLVGDSSYGQVHRRNVAVQYGV